MTAAASTTPARILIVDDEPFNVDYLEQELEGLGFATESAADGFEALHRVAADPPDLILLDVMMPGMDGITALRLLKGDPETRLIPVVLMTALNAVEDRVRGIEAGADDFLSKPVDDRELLARIRTALALKRTIDETVDELASTSAHLERYGRQQRAVAVLAADWRLRADGVPEKAVSFAGRRHRGAAEERMRALGGTLSERDAGPLVAVFEGPDERSRSTAAVEAALAVLADATPDAGPDMHVSIAVSAGPASVGSTRVTHDGAARWLYGAEGETVDDAVRLARGADEAGVLVAGAAAAAVSDRFALQAQADGTYRVLGPIADANGSDAARPPHDRRLMTILVTDIVGSTRILERVGDRAWGELVSAHERATRDQLGRFGGEEINTVGDGFLAAFDTPAQAIRSVFALMARLDELGLTIRAGIHTGEVEYGEGSARGIALNIASRIAAHASPAEVLVSATTRELAAGSGIVFTDRGAHALEGVSEPRQLYAAVDVSTPPIEEAGPVAGRPEVLSARELDVLRLVAAGLSDAEAAAQLFLSVRTVNAHLRSVYRKLGVRSRAAAGRVAAEKGLLPRGR